MTDQAELEDGKYIAVYYNYNGDYSIEHCILGHSIEYLAEWAYLEKPIERCSKLTIFKVELVNRDIFLAAVQEHNKNEEAEYKKEKKAELLAELKELNK